jgi:hypothetical protein
MLVSNICLPKVLPRSKLIEAAKTAIAINPLNKLSVDRLLRVGPGLKLSRERIAEMTTKFWPSRGVRLTVGFLEGASADLRARILRHMNAWGKTANVEFVQSKSDPQIRIARVPGQGYWSYVGTDILLVDPHSSTMNLDSFTMKTPESEFRRWVRHETGHTIGLEHEHLPRDLINRIDTQKAIAYFGRTQRWTVAEVRQRILTPVEETVLRGTASAQPRSIMSHAIPGFITKNGAAILPSPDIQDFDHSYVAYLYPKADGVHYLVWYGTNRRPNASTSEGYSAQRDKTVHYGQCQVFIPKSHKIGSIGSAWWKRVLTMKDDRLQLLQTREVKEAAYWRTIAEHMSKISLDDRQAVVFVHGYNVSFREAALRAAQIGVDLGIKGAMAFFSWPSQGTLRGYPKDEATIEASEDMIADFLVDFATRDLPRFSDHP